MRTCKVCNQEKSLEGFPENRKVSGGKAYRRYTCSPCWAERSASYRSKWQIENAEVLKERDRKRYARNRDEKVAAYKKHYDKLKRIVFEHYGYVCDCCGESEPRFLTLDHIHNDGAEHRKRMGAGHVFFRWIINHGFPNTIRVLCYNCNSGRHHNGGVCPHEERHADIVPIGWKPMEVK